MREHDCTLGEALSATAKQDGEVSGGTIDQLERLMRARTYMEANGGTLANALHKTSTASGTSRNCLDIAEQMDHIVRAKEYQMENHCGLEEAMSSTASK